ncbi:MAG: 23S rRNA (adenine(2503)-C(2))-methyltransferase RlmN [Synergistaceae bacterium]|nr:23S rRNA (adenine(2503)-C(2))-methyltransferase RlmN [Synergistaceae bacterium]
MRFPLDLGYEEWQNLCTEEWGEPRFRAEQICHWLYSKRTFAFGEMTNLSLALRKKAEETFGEALPKEIRRVVSRRDGTEKILWALQDGERIESVLLKQEGRLTACVSTQVGCPLKCSFCATGQSGFVRNLSCGEIVGQFMATEKLLGMPIDNLVFMGMGEPFLNFENFLKAVGILKHPKMRNLGSRRMTVSTAGIVPGILALAEANPGIRLAVSLHAPDDDLRSRLMPVNERYPIEQLLSAVRVYQERTKDRVSIEYMLIGGLNDTQNHAKALAERLRGLKSFVNLIPWNRTCQSFKKASPEAIENFRHVLLSRGIETEVRRERGEDIDAACGQLRRKEEGRNRHWDGPARE